jgi:hypothetical protein
MGAVRSYLAQGIFEGASGDTGLRARVTNRYDEPLTEYPITKGFKLDNSEFVNPAAEYTLTWWHQFTAAGGGSWRSVLHYGSSKHSYPKSPSVLQYPSTLDEPNTRLSFIVSHTDDPDFHCDPEPHLEVNSWTYITLAVSKNSISVFYNGEPVCTNTSSTKGTTLVSGGLDMYFGDPFHPAAYAKLAMVTYYKNEMMKAGMAKTIMALERENPPLNSEKEADKAREDSDELIEI